MTAKIRREAEFSRSVVVMGWRLTPFGEGKKADKLSIQLESAVRFGLSALLMWVPHTHCQSLCTWGELTGWTSLF